jgi:hypothetical protein
VITVARHAIAVAAVIVSLSGCALLPLLAQSGGAAAGPASVPVAATARVESAARPASPPVPASAAPGGVVTVTVPATSAAAQPPAPSAPAASAPAPAADVRTVSGNTAFATPSGRIVCAMTPTYGVRCDYIGTDLQWKLKATNCEFYSGTSLSVGKSGPVPSCISDAIGDLPSRPEETSWYRSGDPTTKLPNSTMVLRALPYGSAIQVTGFRCDSQTSGVTCVNTSTGRGFFMSRESYRFL